VYDVETMQGRIGDVTSAERFSALLLTLFAAMALVLAMIGTYGVISYSVAQRTCEFGVRVALGATRADVVGLVVRQGASLAAAGMAGGLVAAAVTTRMLKSMLYAVEPGDPATMLGIVIVLTISVLVASWIPARRAAGVPAVQALRGD
jgi:ABC-type antimicrobial peptide transport system permease subunit